MRPELIENSLFFFKAATGRTDVLYRQVAANGMPTGHTTVAKIEMLGTPPASGDLTGDPMLDVAWHLLACFASSLFARISAIASSVAVVIGCEA